MVARRSIVSWLLLGASCLFLTWVALVGEVRGAEPLCIPMRGLFATWCVELPPVPDDLMDRLGEPLQKGELRA